MSKPSDLSVSVVATDALVLDPRNARTHGRRNLEAIQASLTQFGQRRPLVVTGGMTVVAGNGTLEAARALGWADIAVTVVPSEWSAEQARAYALADNRTAELASWDEDVLLETLTELDLAGWDMDVLGFEPPDRLSGIVEDEAPEPSDDPITRPGDVWALGGHRLLCGDSTDASQVSRLMEKTTARMMFTDPPWNVAIGSDSNPRHRQRQGLANDDLPPEQFQAFLDAFLTAARPHVAGDVYCVLGASEWPRLDATLRGHGYHWSATIVWVKDQFVLGRSKYQRRYEPIWYGWHEQTASSFGTRRDLDDVWEIPRPRRSEEHPTMKPVEVPARAISHSSRVGDVIFDPFLGSGTTLIACQQLGRVCRGLELDPGYCDVVIRRWENLSGEKAVLVNGEG
jgi:DNA modification methylase